MIRLITYTLITFFIINVTVSAQEKTFENEMKKLSVQLDEVIKTEKRLLRNEIKIIENKYNKDKISFEEAKTQKEVATKLHAGNIKAKTSEIENKIHYLVQNKVNTTIDKKEKDYHYAVQLNVINDSVYYKKRTLPYLVAGLGACLLTNSDGDIFKWSSGSVELGVNFKTRMFKKSGLLYINYGLSYRSNNYKFKNSQYFVTDDNQTLIQNHTIDLKKSEFKIHQIVLPLFLEFDFSKPRFINGKTIFRRNAGFRLGFGGFGGFNIGANQFIKYELEGKKVKINSRGNYNVTNFVYGIQGLIGYRDTSFYVKYDMQDLFTDSLKNQKNISLGVRFDM